MKLSIILFILCGLVCSIPSANEYKVTELITSSNFSVKFEEIVSDDDSTLHFFLDNLESWMTTKREDSTSFRQGEYMNVCQNIRIINNDLLCSTPDSLGVFDVSDPKNPVYLKHLTLQFTGMIENVGILFAENDIAIVGDTNSLIILNYGGSAVEELSTIDAESTLTIKTVSKVGNTVYVGYSDHISLYDVSDIESPTYSKSIDIEAFTSQTVDGTRIIFGGINNVTIFDTKTDSIVHTFAASAYDSLVLGNYLLITSASTLLSIYDITDPTNPLLQSKVNPYDRWQGWGITNEGSFIYITLGKMSYTTTEWESKILGFDISTPTSPTLFLDVNVDENLGSMSKSYSRKNQLLYVGNNFLASYGLMSKTVGKEYIYGETNQTFKISTTYDIDVVAKDVTGEISLTKSLIFIPNWCEESTVGGACSNHGTCVNNKCECEPTYWGNQCECMGNECDHSRWEPSSGYKNSFISLSVLLFCLLLL